MASEQYFDSLLTTLRLSGLALECASKLCDSFGDSSDVAVSADWAKGAVWGVLDLIAESFDGRIPLTSGQVEVLKQEFVSGHLAGASLAELVDRLRNITDGVCADIVGDGSGGYVMALRAYVEPSIH